MRLVHSIVNMTHYLGIYFHNLIRLRGYLKFYENIHFHGSLPFLVVSLFTAALLLVQGLMQQYYPDNFTQACLKDGSMSPRAYLCALITVEFCTIAGINISYMMKVIKFNRDKPPPDVVKNESLTTGNPDTFAGNKLRVQEVVPENQVLQHRLDSSPYDTSRIYKQVDVKPIGVPMGRMSAYAFFVQAFRQEYKEKHIEEQADFSEFSRKCAQRWKTMGDEEKKRFQEMAESSKKLS